MNYIKYVIYFNDNGGSMAHKGKIIADNGIFLCYSYDCVIKYMIPACSVKYIKIED